MLVNKNYYLTVREQAELYAGGQEVTIADEILAMKLEGNTVFYQRFGPEGNRSIRTANDTENTTHIPIFADNYLLHEICHLAFDIPHTPSAELMVAAIQAGIETVTVSAMAATPEIMKKHLQTRINNYSEKSDKIFTMPQFRARDAQLNHEHLAIYYLAGMKLGTRLLNYYKEYEAKGLSRPEYQERAALVDAVLEENKPFDFSTRNTEEIDYKKLGKRIEYAPVSLMRFSRAEMREIIAVVKKMNLSAKKKVNGPLVWEPPYAKTSKPAFDYQPYVEWMEGMDLFNRPELDKGRFNPSR